VGALGHQRGKSCPPRLAPPDALQNLSQPHGLGISRSDSLRPNRRVEVLGHGVGWRGHLTWTTTHRVRVKLLCSAVFKGSAKWIGESWISAEHQECLLCLVGLPVWRRRVRALETSSMTASRVGGCALVTTGSAGMAAGRVSTAEAGAATSRQTPSSRRRSAATAHRRLSVGRPVFAGVRRRIATDSSSLRRVEH